MKILMVCLGNICRSPLAEGILRQKAKEAGLDWEIASAGTTGNQVGCPPHELSQKVAKLNGVDISGQRCRQFKANDIGYYDLVFVMDLENLSEVKRISGQGWNGEKVKLVMDLIYPGGKKEVPDPWYGTEKDYHAVYAMLDEACEAIMNRFKNQ